MFPPVTSVAVHYQSHSLILLPQVQVIASIKQRTQVYRVFLGLYAQCVSFLLLFSVFFSYDLLLAVFRQIVRLFLPSDKKSNISHIR